ncbi:MAG: DUF3108 domain-containing protein [Planctomycetes bacterium]|nr:DUF3108 domain-containing protein [Planctomycetota bacterium]
MRFLLEFLCGALALSAGQAAQAEAVAQEAGFQEASAPAKKPPFRFEPGAEVPALLIPREEKLVYKARLDTGIFSALVGSVTQTCSVMDQPVSLMVQQPAASAGEVASIQLYAEGSYFLYSLESTLETRILPQQWPRLLYTALNKSSQTRRREILVGTKDGALLSSYRGDTSKGAPAGTRIWRPAKERAVPAGTLDMLTAVLQTRTLITGKATEIAFPLIDKDRLWQLKLQRGEERRIETKPGTFFDVVEVVLAPEPYPGEAFAEKAAQFEGVFGINGTIHLWVEKTTGVAVRIQGKIPVANETVMIGIDVVLDSYSGTPEGFAPVPAEKLGQKK